MPLIREDDDPRVVLGVFIVVCAVTWWLMLSPVAIVVEGGYYKTAPASVRLMVQIDPDKHNRVARVSIDSGEFLRAADLPLPGPRTDWVNFRDVPPGDYTAAVVVDRGVHEPWRAWTTFSVR
ncbi:MAG: hypothetical protein ACRD3C_03805 [Vicinamibacterales bacterium]